MIRHTFMIAMVALATSAVAEDWPQFRGPTGDGYSTATNLPATWGGFGGQPAWEVSLPGTGWSSPIVVGERVWLTAAEQTALDTEATAEKLAQREFPDNEFQTHASVQLLLVEVDATSGQLLRRITLADIEDPAPIHLVNSYASPTPVCDGEFIYCHFGSLGTMAVSVKSGQVVWRREFVVDTMTGPAASPILVGDRLILVRDGTDEQYVVAINKRTGKTSWKTSRPPNESPEIHRRGFSTPLLIEQPRRQIISPTANWVLSYDPDTGDELWRVRVAEGHAVVPRPVYAEGVAYVCSGYTHPELNAIRVDGDGDVTDTHVLWTHTRQVPLLSSPVPAGGQLYFVSNNGVATCLDAKTGEQRWQERLRGNFAASPTAADGKLYFTSKEGITTVLRPGREFKKLAENRLFGQTLASLAVFDESLLMRVDQKLVCIQKSPLEVVPD